MSKMAGSKTVSFSPGVLESKLRDLSSTMQSIQELSQWLIHHKKHARSIVGIWFREMQKGVKTYCQDCHGTCFIYSFFSCILSSLFK